ncbi:unnamed protein product [Didymodactylos carnosus]|uniref:3'(2'),5'-bisphosphate nucleotidase n=1 Tax=Didymodactylos carnosus TaxID=1234261 RepID=A0A813XC13_9BILA|nr:unnamed protein product [Didymodactylos carnosus]CAF1226197.1 unnamed protein product [Didymodactylos carnosus]CAF3655282.1 unnamed protein product [Didymodactylos carnosus]CAF4034233.1 unnamed protein product [Didymodactylos carnosus]
MSSYAKEKEIAIEAVRKAALLCEDVRKTIPPAMEKLDKSPVTIADYGSQALICHQLKLAFPNDPIVGEEDCSELKKPEMKEQLRIITNYVRKHYTSDDVTEENVLKWIDYGGGEVSQRYWTLDPIDGTKGFLRQDQYAIALALVENGDVKLGIMGCPALPDTNGHQGQLFVAVRNEGAYSQTFENNAKPTRLQTVRCDDSSNFRFAESVESGHCDQEMQISVAKKLGITTAPIRMDSQAKYGLVASGRAALYLRLPNPQKPDYRENIWDHAAGAIIVEEANGKVTDMNGKKLNFKDNKKMNDNRGVVVSNGEIHEQVLKVLKEM